MSHIITIKAKYKNVNTIKKTCEIVGLSYEYIKDYIERNKHESVCKIGFSQFNKGSQYDTLLITETGDMVCDDMLETTFHPKEFKQFKNTYCLIETESLLKKQGLNYRVIQENDDGIRLEVTA